MLTILRYQNFAFDINYCDCNITLCIAILYHIVTTQYLDTDTVYQVYRTSPVK